MCVGMYGDMNGDQAGTNVGCRYCLTELCPLHFWSPCPHFSLKQASQKVSEKILELVLSDYEVTSSTLNVSVFTDWLCPVSYGMWPQVAHLPYEQGCVEDSGVIDAPLTMWHLWKLRPCIHFALWWFFMSLTLPWPLHLIKNVSISNLEKTWNALLTQNCAEAINMLLFSSIQTCGFCFGSVGPQLLFKNWMSKYLVSLQD